MSRAANEPGIAAPAEGPIGWAELILFCGLTAVLLGYLTVWLPGPAAGLRLIGVELGEWIKFLGVGWSRNWFYLPPITLGLTLAFLTVGRRDRRAWGLRALAVAVSLLAFPAIPAILGEPRSEWLARLLAVVLVAVLAGLSRWLSPVARPRWAYGLAGMAALLGALLPTWQYFMVRPVVERILADPIGVGLGVWLNLVGNLVVAGICLIAAFRKPSPM